MSVLDQTAAFEHMYTPGRAKSLFGRHRDLTTSCEREKHVLDFEWQIVSNQMDKQRNKFRITSAWLWRRLDQLASQAPIVDPAEFGAQIRNRRSPTRARCSRRRSPEEPERPKTAAPPPAGFRPKPRVTYAKSVRSFDESTQDGWSSSTASSGDDGLIDPRIRFSYDDGKPAGTKFGMPMLNFRRRSKAGEKKIIGEMRVQHLKQSCYLQRALLDRKVNQFVEEIEVYKEKHRCDVDGKLESEERDEASCRDIGKASDKSVEKGTAKSNTQLRPSSRTQITTDNSVPEKNTLGANTRPATKKLRKDAAQQPKASGITPKATSMRRDESVVLLRSSFSGVAADGRRQTDAESGPGPRPNTARIDKSRFSLICKDVPKTGRAKKKPVAPQTDEDVTKGMMLGAWEAFSENVGPESFQDLVAFAAKHRPKRRTPAKREASSRWASIATRMILAEKAVSAFQVGIEKQRLRRFAVASPRAKEDQPVAFD